MELFSLLSKRNSFRLGIFIVLFIAGLLFFSSFHSHQSILLKCLTAEERPPNIGYTEKTLLMPAGPIRDDSSNTSNEPFYMHYIRYKPHDGKTDFRFTDYLSVLSAVQYLKPDDIFVHGDVEPTGEYWQKLREKNFIRHTHRNITTFVGRRQGKDKKIGFKEHSADIAKLDVLLEYGGVVADFDVFFVRGERLKTILQRKKAVSCYGDADGYNIGLVAARKDSQFLWAWRRSYVDIYLNDWNFQQAFVSKFLSILYRQEVYVLNFVCNNPHPDRNLGAYFHQHGIISWQNSVAIHSYERFGGVPMLGPDDLYKQPLTTHKELLQTIYENRVLPAFDESFVDELDPLIDDVERSI